MLAVLAADAPALLDGTGELLRQPAALVAVAVLLQLSTAAHELAHGLAGRAFGGSVTEIGLRWRLPVVYPYCTVDGRPVPAPALAAGDHRGGRRAGQPGVPAALRGRLAAAPGRRRGPAGAGRAAACSGWRRPLVNLLPLPPLDGYKMLGHGLGRGPDLAAEQPALPRPGAARAGPRRAGYPRALRAGLRRLRAVPGRGRRRRGRRRAAAARPTAPAPVPRRSAAVAGLIALLVLWRGRPGARVRRQRRRPHELTTEAGPAVRAGRSVQTYGDVVAVDGVSLEVRPRRVLRPARPERRRQDHAGRDRRGAARGRRRHGHRARRVPVAAERRPAAADRRADPVVRVLHPAHRAEHLGPSPRCTGWPGRPRRRAGAGRAGRQGRRPGRPALRRPAAAAGDRHRAGARPGADLPGRAHRGPGPAGPPRRCGRCCASPKARAARSSTPPTTSTRPRRCATGSRSWPRGRLVALDTPARADRGRCRAPTLLAVPAGPVPLEGGSALDGVGPGQPAGRRRWCWRPGRPGGCWPRWTQLGGLDGVQTRSATLEDVYLDCTSERAS